MTAILAPRTFSSRWRLRARGGKTKFLEQAVPGQRVKHWFAEETFLGLMRLRGMECAARYRSRFIAARSSAVRSLFQSAELPSTSARVACPV